jgi:ethanolamine utilization protein EutA
VGETLLSLGLDVGTTTTSLILSRLTAENRASAFAVPDMQITQRWVLYRSEVIFTPICGRLVDGSAIRDWVAGQYALAGIAKNQVDTGAVIITGETSRRENADQVLRERRR